MIKRSQYLGIFFVLLVFFKFILIITPITSSASCPPVCIALNEAEKTANVGPGDNGAVNFSGMVYVETVGPGTSIQKMEVTLSVDAGDWPAAVTPTVMIFEPHEHEKPFFVTVQVPLGTDFGDNGDVYIDGKACLKPGIPVYNHIPGTRGIISIAPYCIMNLSCPRPDKSGNPGDTVRYDLIIKNDGNGDDRFVISSGNRSGYPESYKPFACQTRNLEVFVERGGEARIQVNITIDNRAKPGIFPIFITAASLTQMEVMNVSAKETCSITLEIEEKDATWLGFKFFLYSGGIAVLLCIALGLILLKKRRN